jgi:hypothetical protein
MRIHSAFAVLAFAAAAVGLASCTEGSTNNVPIQQVPAGGGSGGTITPSTGSMSFTTAGASGGFTVTENGYTGTLTAANGTPSCAGIATFSPASGTGPVASFTVTAVAAGNCQIKISDSSGNSTAVSVTVTTTGGSIS